MQVGGSFLQFATSITAASSTFFIEPFSNVRSYKLKWPNSKTGDCTKQKKLTFSLIVADIDAYEENGRQYSI